MPWPWLWAAQRAGDAADPDPAVLMTIGLVWWIGMEAGGFPRRVPGPLLYVLLSTDPYLFGNGSNMEHFMNLFSVASLAFVIMGWNSTRRGPFLAAGASLGAAVLVKQVAVLSLAVYLPALALRRGDQPGDKLRSRMTRAGDLIGFGLGLATVLGLAVLVLVVQGAGRRSLRRHHAIWPSTGDRYFARARTRLRHSYAG